MGRVWLAGREISPELLRQLQLRAGQGSRRELAAELCAQGDWRTPAGRPALMTARKALAGLARDGLLPAPLHRPPPAARVPAVPTFPAVVGPLAALQPLEIQLVPAGRSARSTQWRQLLHHHHYVGAGPLCGAQLR